MIAIRWKQLRWWPAIRLGVLVGLLVGNLAAYPSSAGWAQKTQGKEAAQDEAIMRDDPVLAQVPPDLLRIFLAPLRGGKLATPPLRDATPTPAEELQFTQNRAFAALRQRDPDGALYLLRQANKFRDQ